MGMAQPKDRLIPLVKVDDPAAAMERARALGRKLLGTPKATAGTKVGQEKPAGVIPPRRQG